MPADPIIVSESPRSAVTDRKSDAGKLEDSLRSWAREVVVALRGLIKRVVAVESSTASLETRVAALATAPTSSVATPALASPRTSSPVSAENIGGGRAIFKEKIGSILKLRTLVEGPNIQIEDTGDTIKIGLKLMSLDLSTITPTGAVQMWPAALTTVPAGWLLCDGAVLNVADYPVLGTLLGATYGGDGVTTFGLPDSRDRFPLGPSAAEDPGATGGTVQHKHEVGTLINSDETAGTPSGTINSVSAGTPAGSLNSVSAGTPAGSIDAHTSTTETISVGVSPVLTGPATHTFTGSALPGHSHTFTGSALAGHSHTFAGDALGNHTHTISGKTDVNEDLAASTATADVLPPFLKLAFIIKT